MVRESELQEDVLKSSTIVVFNSSETAKSYSEFAGPVIPIGIDSELFSPADNKQRLRRKHGLDWSGPVGIFVGAFNDVKGWDEVITLFNDNNEGPYLIAVSKFHEHYYSQTSRSYSRINQNLLAELMGSCDFFILGSSVETQCLSALEAGFCNLPIIMKKTGIFMDWPASTRQKIGCFEESLSDAFRAFKQTDPATFKPRETLEEMKLDIAGMIQKWSALLTNLSKTSAQ
jgi:hypothetical protein